MFKQLRNTNFYVLALADFALFAFSLLLSYCIRFNFEIPGSEAARMFSILPGVVITKFVVFYCMGAYRGMWRYTSLSDIVRLFKASAIASLLIVAFMAFVVRMRGYPRSVFLADFVFTFMLCGGMRAIIRIILSPQSTLQRLFGLTHPHAKPKHTTRLMIIGAGYAADKIIREIRDNPRSPYEIICCLDDDPQKHGRSILDVPVEGKIDHIADIVESLDIQEIIICMPAADGDRMRQVVTLCESTGLPFRTLPSLSELIGGHVTVSDLRPVRFEDLLGRPPNDLDNQEIGAYITDKVVMVTGAGGSIGSEICRQLIDYKPACLILLEASEFNLYNIHNELCMEYRFSNVCPIMGHVQDRAFMQRIFARYRPAVVMHAAACKHVPMVELNPWEGIHNNILGSQTAMDLSEEFGVDRFVLISTDKAVRPTNVMGATKRASEILLQTRPASKTRFMAVRFGNVVGSSGSVIPLFQQQIKAGHPVTVTHPDITRYFMTIPEACQLVLQTGAIGEGGEIFVLEMGTPVKIADMARDLIRLSGKEPDVDIPIVYTGLRPGEKLYEELITADEDVVPTEHEKIMVLRNHHAAYSREKLLEDLDTLLHCTQEYEIERLKAVLKDMIPEYKPSQTPSNLCPLGTGAKD